MPSNMSQERRDAMAAYGAELLSVPAGAMEMARDLAMEMQADGQGTVLNQFGNFGAPPFLLCCPYHLTQGKWESCLPFQSLTVPQVEKCWPESSYFLLSREEQ